MNNKNTNPLFAPQKDKAGGWTFDKYDYQYHWALYEVLSRHKERKEYAVFIEYHEDVIIADSLDVDCAKFDFNQVKTTNVAYTPHQLTIRKKKKKVAGASVLGKLVSSIAREDIGSQISYANLVALNGFNLELKDKGVCLKKIQLDDLSENHYKVIEEAIIKELNISSLPTNIQFIIPTLNEHNYEEQVIGMISKLVNLLFPTSQCNSEEIYRSLIDELHKKGKVTYDFSKWNDFLKEKALTSITVSNTIANFTSIKDETTVEMDFNNICNELGIKSIYKAKLHRAFNRYRQLRISNNSTNQIDIKKEIINLIHRKMDAISDDESFENLLEYVISNIGSDIKSQFPDDTDIKGAIICEFVMLD